MELKRAFGAVLGWVRSELGYTQEDFSVVSSRTYVSTLERGIYSPTLEKLDDIASVLRIHPVTMLVGTYALSDNRTMDEILAQVREEIESIQLQDGMSILRSREL